jgi:shikimate 5-dehydrogenase
VEAVDGLGMLVHQAAVQVELWTKIPAPVEDMWNAALHGV